MARRTVTGLITTAGRHQSDWTGDYRLLSKGRFDPDAVFGVVRQGVIGRLDQGAPLVVAIDDTATRKAGRRIPGAAWRRDPLGPPFHTNFIWGRRFLQISALLPSGREDAPGRAIPVDLRHAPTPKKPKRTAPPDAWASYREEARRRSLGRQAADRLSALRASMDADGEEGRPLWVCGDGGYTNRTVLEALPRHTVMVGRIRSDAVMHPPPDPDPPPSRGRRRLYGVGKITPEDVRKDDAVPWQAASVYAAGRVHELRFKTVGPLLWRAAGPGMPLRLFVIAPLAYRPSKGSRLLYRNPAYLVCTDPGAGAENVLRAYVSRWDIEVNFRDEKQIFGLDEAQVRTEPGARLAPALAAGAYALLLLASLRAFGTNGLPGALPTPKWRRGSIPPRASTSALVNHLRLEMWSHSIDDRNFCHFTSVALHTSKPEKFIPDLRSALFCSRPAA